MVGSRVFKKYLGDGPKWGCTPYILFIDEISATGSKRYDSNSEGEREIQRTFELVGWISFKGRREGYQCHKQNGNLALIRQGRPEKMEILHLRKKTNKQISEIHMSRMTLADDNELITGKVEIFSANNQGRVYRSRSHGLERA